MLPEVLLRIDIIGNIAGGKTHLARRLSEVHQVPVTHIDAIQFTAQLEMRPLVETRERIRAILREDRWILDGYGPLDLLESRLLATDVIVFVDFPLIRHLWWLAKRQVRSLWSPRKELPTGSRETTLKHTYQLLRRMFAMHTKMRPEVLRLLSRQELSPKVVRIRSLKDWNRCARFGVSQVGG